jgi:hypothetical protein
MRNSFISVAKNRKGKRRIHVHHHFVGGPIGLPINKRGMTGPSGPMYPIPPPMRHRLPEFLPSIPSIKNRSRPNSLLNRRINSKMVFRDNKLRRLRQLPKLNTDKIVSDVYDQKYKSISNSPLVTSSSISNIEDIRLDDDEEKMWKLLSKHMPLTDKYISKHVNDLKWPIVCAHQKLSEELIEKHVDKVDWPIISRYQKLSEDFINKHADKVDWFCITEVQQLSEEFIEKHKDRLNWLYVSIFQNLSEEFIKKHADKVHWREIIKYQKLSHKFIKKYNINVPDDNWLYKDTLFKIDRVKDRYKVYDINKNPYIIAYKTVREDNKSIFSPNFYDYSKSNIHQAHCDFNEDVPNSFGLAAWTKEKAIGYALDNHKQKFNLMKVKIYIDDMVLTNEDKIRCNKLEIIR